MVAVVYALVLPSLGFAADRKRACVTCTGGVERGHGVRVAALHADTVWETGDLELSIGQRLGREEYEFGDIAGVVQLPDGTIAAADQLKDEIRFFDRDGAFVKRIGREGNGPGEFQLLSDLFDCADRLRAFDARHDRMSIFSYAGELLRTYDVASPAGAAGRGIYDLECGADGRLVATSYWSANQYPLSAPHSPFRPEVHLGIIGTNGELVRSLGVVPGNEQYFFTRSTSPRPLGAETILAADDRYFYVGDGATRVVHRYTWADASSSPDTLRLPWEPRPLTDSDIQAYVEARTRRITPEASRSARAEELRELEDGYREQTPIYDEMVPGTDGHLWVRRFRADPTEPAEWVVFGVDGDIIAHATTPSDFELAQIGSDFLLGVWTDDAGVEYVRRYELLKP